MTTGVRETILFLRPTTGEEAVPMTLLHGLDQELNLCITHKASNKEYSPTGQSMRKLLVLLDDICLLGYLLFHLQLFDLLQ
jgi:hypothetical protein